MTVAGPFEFVLIPRGPSSTHQESLIIDPEHYPGLRELRHLFSSQNWQLAMPAKFSDPWLRGVARDLRKLDLPDLESCCIERPLFLIACIATARAALLGRHVKAFENEDALRLGSAYQYLVEREIVTRAIGLPLPEDELRFLAMIDFAIEEKAATEAETAAARAYRPVHRRTKRAARVVR